MPPLNMALARLQHRPLWPAHPRALCACQNRQACRGSALLLCCYCSRRGCTGGSGVTQAGAAAQKLQRQRPEQLFHLCTEKNTKVASVHYFQPKCQQRVGPGCACQLQGLPEHAAGYASLLLNLTCCSS